jgi:hypothetical protein
MYVFDCTKMIDNIRRGYIPEYSEMTSIFSRLCRAGLPASAAFGCTWIVRGSHLCSGGLFNYGMLGWQIFMGSLSTRQD